MVCFLFLFCVMLNGCFVELYFEEIDFFENNILFKGMRVISEFSMIGYLNEFFIDLFLEILIFVNKFCCESLKVVCD